MASSRSRWIRGPRRILGWPRQIWYAWDGSAPWQNLAPLCGVVYTNCHGRSRVGAPHVQNRFDLASGAP